MEIDKKYKNQHVFIIGSKGIPAQYGGFETFVDKLTENAVSDKIQYHVACINKGILGRKEYEYHDAHCFTMDWKRIGSAKAIVYDLEALKYAIDYVKQHRIEQPVFYILACRIGPFISYYKRKIDQLGGTLLVNPDGHEWLRAKWNFVVKRYWKYSEFLMVKYTDWLICDSKHIEAYMIKKYSKYHPKTRYIAYGAEVLSSKCEETVFKNWCNSQDIRTGKYYLVVGRFEPENNFEVMIKEFMNSDTKKDLVLVTNICDNHFYQKLKSKTNYDSDKRIKFVGTVYDQELLKKIRESAYGYLHGHEVGGTNPSLLEALASTRINLLYDVGFSHEVGGAGALYWTKAQGNLTALIEEADKLDDWYISQISERARERVRTYYSWEYVVKEYEDLFQSLLV